jgi:hypothetical protein
VKVTKTIAVRRPLFLIQWITICESREVEIPAANFLRRTFFLSRGVNWFHAARLWRLLMPWKYARRLAEIARLLDPDPDFVVVEELAESEAPDERLPVDPPRPTVAKDAFRAKSKMPMPRRTGTSTAAKRKKPNVTFAARRRLGATLGAWGVGFGGADEADDVVSGDGGVGFGDGDEEGDAALDADAEGGVEVGP